MYITEEWKAYCGSILCVLYVNFLMNAVYATEISIKVNKNILKQKQKTILRLTIEKRTFR